MGVKDRVRTDADLHKGSNLGMGVYAIERSYPKVGVGQLWKQYLEQLKNYAHPWKLKLSSKKINWNSLMLLSGNENTAG